MMARRGIGHGLGRRLRGLVLVGFLSSWAALTGAPAAAFEPPPGSKNFTSPGSVPNYFSNEAGPFGRGARVAQPSADRFNTAPAPARASYATAPPTRGTAATAARHAHRKSVRGRSGRHAVSPRAGRAHVRSRARSAHTRHSVKATKATSRHSAATKRRAATNRPRHVPRGVTQARQASR